MNAQKILIVDRQPPVAHKLQNKLNQVGYLVTSVLPALPVPGDLKFCHYDLIAFGKNTNESVKQSFENTLRLNNPKLISLTAMHPSVLADQVSVALNRKKNDSKFISYVNYDINEGCLSVMLRIEADCDVEIGVYNTGIFYGASEKLLFTEKVAPGTKFIKFAEKALCSFGAKFLVIRVNKTPFFMKRL